MTDTVKDLQDHLQQEHDDLQAAIAANKELVAEKLGEAAPAGTFVGGAEDVGGVVGGVLGGVGSTAADAVGAVGTVADAAHNAVDSFFHNVRVRLGL